jgi:hypothetical protein
MGMEQEEVMEMGSVEEGEGSSYKREQKRRKKKKMNSYGPASFQVR